MMTRSRRDAHQRCGRRVLGDGADAAAELGAVDEDVGARARGRTPRPRMISVTLVTEAPKIVNCSSGATSRIGTCALTPPSSPSVSCGQHEVHELLDDERRADRGDQEDQRRGVPLAQRSIGDAFQPDRGAAGDRPCRRASRCPRYTDRQQGALVVHVPAGRESEHHQHRVLPEHAEHEDLGVREVDQPEHAVDQRVADRDERVDRAVGQSVDGQLPEQVARAPRR